MSSGYCVQPGSAAGVPNDPPIVTKNRALYSTAVAVPSTIVRAPRGNIAA